nr:reverse transcriptase domain-containing protein [Tanacetum cinerariifolium]
MIRFQGRGEIEVQEEMHQSLKLVPTRIFLIVNHAILVVLKESSVWLDDRALTWWNSYVQTIGIDKAYEMSWKDLMKLIIDELTLLCPRMVPEEDDEIERMDNGLMDQKVRMYAAKSAEQKRKFDNNPRDNHVQQPPFKRQNKSMKFEWGEKEEATFQLLKKKLCSASILALPKGSKNFVVFCDASHKGLGAHLMQKEKLILYAFRQLKKELNMRQRRWLEILRNYDCKIHYHHGKANMVADALIQKERVKPLRV